MEKFILAILAGIAIAAFGAHFAYRAFRKQRRIKASDQFRNTILTEFSKLYPDGILHFPSNQGGDIVKMIRDKHHVISAAVNVYRPHVRNKAGFDKAWDNFTGVDRFRDKDEKPRYNQYTIKNLQGSIAYDFPRKMFIKNIKQLLEFTSNT
jgi:hypothetical protein